MVCRELVQIQLVTTYLPRHAPCDVYSIRGRPVSLADNVLITVAVFAEGVTQDTESGQGSHQASTGLLGWS